MGLEDTDGGGLGFAAAAQDGVAAGGLDCGDYGAGGGGAEDGEGLGLEGRDDFVDTWVMLVWGKGIAEYGWLLTIELVEGAGDIFDAVFTA